MQVLRNEWNKELEVPLLPRQWEIVLTSVATVSMNLKLRVQIMTYTTKKT